MNNANSNHTSVGAPDIVVPTAPELSAGRVARGLSVLTIAVALTTGCSWSNQTRGTAAGAGAGAVAGAVVGNQTGSTVRGAIIGATVGGAAGMIIGNQMDKHAEELEAALPDAEVQRIGEGIAVTFPDGILFAFDSQELRQEARTNLQEFARSLQGYPNTTVMVVGHTDGDGTTEYNQSLSERRARAAADFIVANGLTGNRISTLGAGESEPIATNSTDAGKSQNRRVEVAIFSGG